MNIKKTIERNDNISGDFKPLITNISKMILKLQPDQNFKFLKDNLSNLKIKEATKEEILLERKQKRILIVKYLHYDNTIIYNKNIKENNKKLFEQKLTQEMIRVASTVYNKEKDILFSGFYCESKNKESIIKDIGIALNEGMIKFLTKKLKGKNLNDSNSFETFTIEALSQIIEPKKLISYYFDANLDGVRAELSALINSDFFFFKLVGNADKYKKYKNENAKSTVKNELINYFFAKQKNIIQTKRNTVSYNSLKKQLDKNINKFATLLKNNNHFNVDPLSLEILIQKNSYNVKKAYFEPKYDPYAYENKP